MVLVKNIISFIVDVVSTIPIPSLKVLQDRNNAIITDRFNVPIESR
jgi:hypothetical protein